MIHDHPSNLALLENDRQSNLVTLASHSAGPLTRFWNDARKLWVEVRTVHATRRALRRLNDHQLKDIGVEPGAIDKVARASALAHLTVAGLDHHNDRPFR